MKTIPNALVIEELSCKLREIPLVILTPAYEIVFDEVMNK